MTHCQKLERMYLSAPFNVALYPTTSVQFSDRTATITLEVSEKYYHALGAIHGSIYFKMLDDSAFFAANSIVEDVFVLTTNFNVNIVRPVIKGKLKAVGTVKSESARLIIAESSVYDEDGKLVAFGTGHFMKSKMELKNIPAYVGEEI